MRIREGTILVVLVAGTAALISFPPIYGRAICPPNKHFLGFTGLYGPDQAFYLAWGPRQAQDGYLLFEDKYNGPTERRMVFNLLWLVMGWTARLTGLGVAAVFHIERVLFSIVLLVIIHRVLKEFIPQAGWRLVALVLAALGSGFGWMLPSSWGRTPDLWIVESNLFLIMLGETNLPAGLCLLLLSLIKGYKALFEHPRHATWAGILTLLLGAVYPYAVISVYAILGLTAAHLAIERRSLKPLLRVYGKIVLLSVFFVIYDGYLVLTDPNLTAGQKLYRSPDPLKYFLGYGVVSILALVGVLYSLKDRHRRLYFPLLWAVTTFLLIYAPVAFQMQLIVGVQVPLVVLAVYGLSRLSTAMVSLKAAGWRRALAGWGLIYLLALSLPTNIHHYAGILADLRRFDVPEYLDLSDYEAMQWLKARSSDREVVVASRPASLVIPVISHNRVYAGDHAGVTADFERKMERLNWFFTQGNAKSDAEIRAFLMQNQIRYIYFDRRLREEFGRGMLDRLAGLPYIQPAFQNHEVIILRVELNSGNRR